MTKPLTKRVLCPSCFGRHPFVDKNVVLDTQKCVYTYVCPKTHERVEIAAKENKHGYYFEFGND